MAGEVASEGRVLLALVLRLEYLAREARQHDVVGWLATAICLSSVYPSAVALSTLQMNSHEIDGINLFLFGGVGGGHAAGPKRNDGRKAVGGGDGSNGGT